MAFKGIVNLSESEDSTILFSKDSWAHRVVMKDYLDSLTTEEREVMLRVLRGDCRPRE